jgi:hypothetical protein
MFAELKRAEDDVLRLRRRREKFMRQDKDPAIRHLAVWRFATDLLPPKMACEVGRRAMLPRRHKDLET